MELVFKPMTRECAFEIVDWSYEAPYEVYGLGGNEPEATINYLCDEQNRFFALLSQNELSIFW